MQTATVDQLLTEIRLLQNIQKAHPSTHPEGQKASAQLAPRFAELARRARAGDATAATARL